MTSYLPSITGVILAGGQARRMGGDDKGLIQFQAQPLVQYAINAVRPQVNQVVINANRNIEQYQRYGYPVVSDSFEGFHGPLAGMLSVMETAQTDYILTVPCDSPFISAQLRQRMMETLLLTGKEIAVATDGERLQPVFCLIPCHLHEDLKQFLQAGDRKIDIWLARHELTEVDFSDQTETFININHPEDLAQYEYHIQSPLPIIGFAANSGTGKTTLLEKLIPALNYRGLRIAVIKHAHHKFDIDKPGKDSYQLRQAGAQQMLIASSKLMALMETRQPEQDPRLAELLPRLDINKLDLILVEGFKHETIAKIELHRPSLNMPLFYPHDPQIQAVASDAKLDIPDHLTQLDLNNTLAIADYIEQFVQQWTS